MRRWLIHSWRLLVFALNFLAPLSLILLASSGPQGAVPTAAFAATATPILHAPAIRFALIGVVTDANVWALFDAKGYSYNNYAVRSEYWPRLYRLSVPDRQLEAEAASGMPSTVEQEAGLYTATVPLRSDLTWTNGSPFTADDVAFTVNTALSFQLGFDWHDYYNPDWLDHAEAVDAQTVKFFFKKAPNAGMFQYGTLQGPVVQKQYWSSKIAEAATLLPPGDLAAQIEALKAKVTDLQKQFDALNAASATTTGEETRQAQANLKRREGDLNEAINDLSKAQSNFDSAMNAACDSLYRLNDRDEPRLGIWEFGASQTGSIENKANAKYPGPRPNFDRALYHTYPTEEAAAEALKNDEVDVILAPNGLSTGAASGILAVQNLMTSPARSLRFLVFNPLSVALGDPALHQALACVVERDALVGQLRGQAAPLESFVLPQETAWFDADAVLPCQGMDSASRVPFAVQILKSAGYTWTQEPTTHIAGQGLTQPDGEPFPLVKLMAPSSDDLRTAAASYIQQQARLLGIPLTAEPASMDEINFTVFSSHQYDMALLGWKVSAYPDYLCDWFGDGNPFRYDESQIKSNCLNLNSTSDLDMAREQVFEIQSALAWDLPFIPLYADVIQDAFRNVTYPFGQVLDGLSGIYGAPALALPGSP